MKTLLIVLLLQMGIFKSNDTPAVDTKVYLEDAKSGDLVAFSKIGQSGAFCFSELDPGVYNISIEIQENSVKEVDNKIKTKFETDIIAAYNKSKKAYGWQRDDGFLLFELTKSSKLAEIFEPKFEYETDENSGKSKESANSGFFSEMKAVSREKQGFAKVKIMQITVANQYGSISGSINSVTQKEFHKLMVGTGDTDLESQNIVEVLQKREE